METFPYDFRDERMMTHIRSVIRKCAVSVGTEEVSAILQSLLNRLTDLEKYEKFLLSLSEKEQEKTKLSKVIWQFLIILFKKKMQAFF